MIIPRILILTGSFSRSLRIVSTITEHSPIGIIKREAEEAAPI